MADRKFTVGEGGGADDEAADLLLEDHTSELWMLCWRRGDCFSSHAKSIS